MFFAFDGIDGVGKSTQMRLLCDWLKINGREVLECRDPGSTPLGERLREILLHSGAETPISLRAEMLLYMAARAQLVESVLRPALDHNLVVISDRYLLANLAYQAYAGGLAVEQVRSVGQVATDGLMPDLVFLLDMDPATADARIERERDRLESRGAEYRRRLREGFLAEATRDPKMIQVIDANQSVEEVHKAIVAAVDPLILRKKPQSG